MRGPVPTFPQYPFMAWWLLKHHNKSVFTFNHNNLRLVLLNAGALIEVWLPDEMFEWPFTRHIKFDINYLSNYFSRQH
jgi:hypothetical protein